MTQASAITCDAVSVRFGGASKTSTLAVDAVDLAVPAGKITALIGPSGCGKTTLLRLMANLQSATSGTVRLEPPADGRKGEIAFVFQQPALLPWASALANVMLPLKLARTRNRGRDAAMELLETVGLADAAHRYPDQLSGGMKMRVSIARALVTEPKVLLLDEPFAALDDMLRNTLGDLLLELWQTRRFTTVIVTHNIAEAIQLSHQIGVMGHGHLTQVIDNPMPFPRSQSLRRTPEFGQFYGRVSDALRGDHE